MLKFSNHCDITDTHSTILYLAASHLNMLDTIYCNDLECIYFCAYFMWNHAIYCNYVTPSACIMLDVILSMVPHKVCTEVYSQNKVHSKSCGCTERTVCWEFKEAKTDYELPDLYIHNT